MKRMLLTFALLVAVVVANAQVTTSSLRGVVTTDGKPIPGATVIAVHKPSGTTYGRAVDNEGNYHISGMRVGGPYSITISYIGFKTITYSNVELPLGETVVIDANLREEDAIIDEIVIAYATEDMHTQNFSSSSIGKIPTIERSIYDLTKLMPTAVKPAAGGIILGGQSTRYNAFTIDGTSSADIYGLGTTGMTGSLTNANPIPLDAIAEVQISTASVDLRESGFTGGSINAVTRSGDNEFRGSAYTYYNNEHFWGTTPGKDVAKRNYLADQTTNIYGVTIGGPVIKDKLHFFLAGEFNRTTRVVAQQHSHLTRQNASRSTTRGSQDMMAEATSRTM